MDGYSKLLARHFMTGWDDVVARACESIHGEMVFIAVVDVNCRESFYLYALALSGGKRNVDIA